ncbi:MAG TPA: hypothetical protein VLL27_14135 [Solirubrobacterales bacterium]|nr:hypothetical protein [Solirubrobacterales bacterium]
MSCFHLSRLSGPAVPPTESGDRAIELVEETIELSFNLPDLTVPPLADLTPFAVDRRQDLGQIP